MKTGIRKLYTAAQIAQRIARVGKSISRDYKGRTLDVVALLDNSIFFVSDLLRQIDCNVVCHFVRAEIRTVEVGGYERREIFFSPEPLLKNRDVLLVDAVLHTGVTLDFWARRLMEGRPRSLRTAVLIDKPAERRVNFQPDYACFETASKHLIGYGLPGPQGQYRNLPFVGSLAEGRRAASPRPVRRQAKRSARVR